MFERKFLAYLLYITLLEIREEAYIKENNRLFYLTDLLHNIPFCLFEADEAKEEYNNVLRGVDHLKINDWLKAREKEFYDRFPEHRNN